jgi:hypothetical protein
MEKPFDLLKHYNTLQTVDIETIKKYESILPEFLINEWKERGFSSYLNGLLITTNPEDYYEIMKGWASEPENCHVVMRTAFGSLYYFKEDEYHYISVIHNLSSNLKKRLDFIIKYILNNKESQKNILHKDIYDKVYKRLGAPNYNEVYAFVPAIAIGGDYNPDNVKKVKLKEHLAFLQQLI